LQARHVEPDDPDEIVSWTRREKERAMAVVQAIETRALLLHAVKRTAQIITAVLGAIVVMKAAGLGAVWNAFIMWIAQR
jgi:hypothetical protein